MQALIDGHRFIDAVTPIRIIKPGLQLDKGKLIGPIAVHFVRARKAEWAFRTKISCSDQQVQRSDSVSVEVVVRYRGRGVMRRLCRGVDYEIRTLCLEEIADRTPIAHV
jgi:hypothetical protein